VDGATVAEDNDDDKFAAALAFTCNCYFLMRYWPAVAVASNMSIVANTIASSISNNTVMVVAADFISLCPSSWSASG
jgi:hypothetical protein